MAFWWNLWTDKNASTLLILINSANTFQLGIIMQKFFFTFLVSFSSSFIYRLKIHPRIKISSEFVPNFCLTFALCNFSRSLSWKEAWFLPSILSEKCTKTFPVCLELLWRLKLLCKSFLSQLKRPLKNCAGCRWLAGWYGSLYQIILKFELVFRRTKKRWHLK